MAKIRIELDSRDWNKVLDALWEREIGEEREAKELETLLEPDERAEKIVEWHRKNAERYRNLQQEIERQKDAYILGGFCRQEKNNGADLP